MSEQQTFDDYDFGQFDVLELLNGWKSEDDDDHVWASFANDYNRLRYSLWCLSANLRAAAGLEMAYRLGGDDGYMAAIWAWERDTWRPGCGRAVAGWEGEL